MSLSTLEKLPAEILQMMFEPLGKRDLKACCLTSLALLEQSRSFLYRIIRLRFAINYITSQIILNQTSKLLCNTIQKNGSLAQHVRSAHIVIADAPRNGDPAFCLKSLANAKSWTMLIQTLSVARHNQELRISDYSSSCHVIFMMLSQKDLTFEHVQKLSVTTHVNISTATFAALLDRFPKLVRLSFSPMRSRTLKDGHLHFSIRHEEHKSPVMLHHLRHLTLEGKQDYTEVLSRCKSLNDVAWDEFGFHDGDDGAQTATVSSVLKPSLSTLQELNILVAREGNPVKLSQLDISRISHLRRLYLCHWMFAVSDQPNEIFQAFFAGSLQEFEWRLAEPHVQALLTGSVFRKVTETLFLAAQYQSRLKSFALTWYLTSEQPQRIADIGLEMSVMEKTLSNKGIKVKCMCQAPTGKPVTVHID